MEASIVPQKTSKASLWLGALQVGKAGWPVSPGDPPILTSPIANTITSSFLGIWVWNSGPHALQVEVFYQLSDAPAHISGFFLTGDTQEG